MKTLIALVAVFLFSLAQVAVAVADDGGFYLAAKIGFSRQDVSRTFEIKESWDFNAISVAAGDVNMGSYNNSSIALGFAIGYNFYPRLDVPIRFDIDYVYRGYTDVKGTHPIDLAIVREGTVYPAGSGSRFYENSSIGVHTIMANLYWDFINPTSFTPYVGVGLGLALLHIDTKGDSYIEYGPVADKRRESDSIMYGGGQFAWSLATGVAYTLTNDIALELGYRYISGTAGSVTSGWIDEFDLDSSIKIHDVLLGFRYTF
jgi:opacity protein-like surface antigen